jgi:flagellar biosynthesis/type III secretory pathway chaperone
VRLLEQESAILNAMKPGEIADLQARKAELVTEYEGRLKAMSSMPELKRRLKPALLQELGLAAETLKQAIDRNGKALAAAKMATDQLVHSIASAVVEEQRVQSLYRADGRSSPTTQAGAPVAVSVNQVL